mgnify:CR=1 FL=1
MFYNIFNLIKFHIKCCRSIRVREYHSAILLVIIFWNYIKILIKRLLLIWNSVKVSPYTVERI